MLHKIKQGSKLISNVWLGQSKLIITLWDKWSYESSNFEHGILTIATTKGEEIAISFTDQISIDFDYHEKDQIIFKCRNL